MLKNSLFLLNCLKSQDGENRRKLNYLGNNKRRFRSWERSLKNELRLFKPEKKRSFLAPNPMNKRQDIVTATKIKKRFMTAAEIPDDILVM